MLYAIPLFIGSHILNPIVRREIHNFHLLQDFFGQNTGQVSLWCCGKNHIHQRCQFFQIIILADIFHNLKHILIHFVILLIYVTSGTIPDNLCVLMSHQNSHQFSTGISGCSDNTHFNHDIHTFLGPFALALK